MGFNDDDVDGLLQYYKGIDGRIDKLNTSEYR